MYLTVKTIWNTNEFEFCIHFVPIVITIGTKCIQYRFFSYLRPVNT